MSSKNIVQRVRDWMKKYDNDGREICDPTPVSRKVRLKQETIEEKIARLVREREYQAALADQGLETFEEAEDFDIPDDPIDPTTPYETVFEPSLGKEITRAEAAFLNEQRSAFKEEFVKTKSPPQKPSKSQRAEQAQAAQSDDQSEA